MTKHNRQPAGGGKQKVDHWVPWALCRPVPGLSAKESWPWCTACLSYTHPAPAEAVTYCGLLFSFRQVAQGQSQAVSDTDQHQNPSQEPLSQHTQWPASANIRAGTNKFHKWFIYWEILAGT